MYLLESDCIIYKVNKEISLDKCEYILPSEKLEIETKNSKYIKFVFSWIDPIRAREKIIAKDRNRLTLIYFYNKKIISCFGSSESQIGFVINKFERILGIKLEKIDVFNNYKIKIKAELINLHFFNDNSINLESEDYTQKLSVKNATEANLKQIFYQHKITLLTFKVTDDVRGVSYFYVDRGSVVSFPDLMKEDVAYEILQRHFTFLK
ncbi:hypothetical protein [Paraliobacillus sediminis]|uniref:hypothetical protein n=1 Tax=Paraliobacillus sediminis TaxID=1885916 RepID=UPI000E3B7BAD|nr:hypothetical protein [Paraliobacillus sediminis]